MDDFEKFLSKQTPRAIPPEWRAQILQAVAVSAEAAVEIVEPPVAWWRQLLWPSPMAWASVGCVWLVIIGFEVASGSSESPATTPLAQSAEEIESAMQQQRQLVQELFRAEEQAVEPPRRKVPGACLRRESATQIA